MNSKTMKQIHRHADTILLQWIHSLLNEKEAKLVTKQNISDYMPQQTHTYFNFSFRLAPFSRKWVRKNIKKIVARNPQQNISEISLDNLKSMIKPM